MKRNVKSVIGSHESHSGYTVEFCELTNGQVAVRTIRSGRKEWKSPYSDGSDFDTMADARAYADMYYPKAD